MIPGQVDQLKSRNNVAQRKSAMLPELSRFKNDQNEKVVDLKDLYYS